MEATRETLQRCLVLALTPVLNQMSVMGVVSIPGMMTGQILGGTVPSQVCCRCITAKTEENSVCPWILYREAVVPEAAWSNALQISIAISPCTTGNVSAAA